MATHSGKRLVWVSDIIPGVTLDSATWLEMTRHLRSLGWHVTLIGIGADGEHVVDNVTVRCFPRPPLYFFGKFVFFVHVLRYLLVHWDDIDVILFHHMAAFVLFPLRFVRVLKGTSHPLLVLDTRDLADPTLRNWRARIRTYYFGIVYAFGRFCVDGQTAITSRMAALVRIPQRQLWGIWPSGVAPERFAAAQDARRWPSDDDPIVLVYIGIFLPKRHLAELARAVIAANEQGMSFHLLLAGDGPDRGRLEKIAAESSGTVEVMQPVRHEDVPHLLARAHVGVTSLPEVDDVKYQASSPIKLFEYMAAGMPFLATANVCHTDVAGGASFAFWIDTPTDDAIVNALRAVWRKRRSLAQLGLDAAAEGKNWTWQSAAGKLDVALLHGVGPQSTSTREALGA